MTISRRQLYAAGLPLGDCATRREAGRVIYGGGGGSSSSSTTTANTTDKRMVVDQGVGVSSDSSTVNVTALDAGAIQAALSFAAGNDATVGAGFTALLDSANKQTFSTGDSFSNLLKLADKLFTTGSDVLSATSATTLAQVSALNTAQNDAAGSIDQKTMIALGITAAVGLYAVMGKK